MMPLHTTLFANAVVVVGFLFGFRSINYDFKTINAILYATVYCYCIKKTATNMWCASLSVFSHMSTFFFFNLPFHYYRHIIVYALCVVTNQHGVEPPTHNVSVLIVFMPPPPRVPQVSQQKHRDGELFFFWQIVHNFPEMSITSTLQNTNKPMANEPAQVAIRRLRRQPAIWPHRPPPTPPPPIRIVRIARTRSCPAWPLCWPCCPAFW